MAYLDRTWHLIFFAIPFDATLLRNLLYRNTTAISQLQPGYMGDRCSPHASALSAHPHERKLANADLGSPPSRDAGYAGIGLWREFESLGDNGWFSSAPGSHAERGPGGDVKTGRGSACVELRLD